MIVPTWQLNPDSMSYTLAAPGRGTWRLRWQGNWGWDVQEREPGGILVRVGSYGSMDRAQRSVAVVLAGRIAQKPVSLRDCLVTVLPGHLGGAVALGESITMQSTADVAPEMVRWQQSFDTLRRLALTDVAAARHPVLIELLRAALTQASLLSLVRDYCADHDLSYADDCMASCAEFVQQSGERNWAYTSGEVG